MSDSDFNSVTHHRWDKIPAEPLKGTISRRLITGNRMMIAHVYLKKGGEREFTVKAGEVVVIPSHVPHRALALEDTLDVDIFDPPREDWLTGTDAYLRR